MADETHQLYELKRVMPPPGDSAETDFVQGVLRNVPLFKTEFLLTQLLSLNELSPKAIIFIIDFGTTAALADSRFHRPVSCLLRDLCARLSFRQCTSDFRSLVTRRCRWEFSDESKLASSLAPVRFSNICGFLAQLHSTALLTDRSLQDVLSVMAQVRGPFDRGIRAIAKISAASGGERQGD